MIMSSISLRLLLMLATTTSRPASASPVLAKSNTCAANNLLSCPSGLPSDFCCPKDYACQALAGNTTAVCCPSGQTCNFVQPITCNVQDQNPQKSLDGSVKTSVFDVKLPACGSETCCPFGYSCQEDSLCRRNEDQSKTPQQAAQSASSTTTTTTTTTAATSTSTSSSAAAKTQSNTSTSTATSTSTSSSASTAPASDSGSQGPVTTSIIGGVVGGCLVLLLIAVIIFLYIRRSNRRNAASTEKTGHGHRRGAGSIPTISDPIIHPNSYRTDFILKTASARTSSEDQPAPRRAPSGRAKSGRLPPRISIPNPFTSPNPSTQSELSPASSRASAVSREEHPPREGQVNSTRLKPIRAMKAASSRVSRRFLSQQHPPSLTPGPSRESSGENIDVFADPETVNSAGGGGRERERLTTFTDMMAEADLDDPQKGRPYVPGTTPRI